jgi:hypothetical protein
MILLWSLCNVKRNAEKRLTIGVLFHNAQSVIAGIFFIRGSRMRGNDRRFKLPFSLNLPTKTSDKQFSF